MSTRLSQRLCEPKPYYQYLLEMPGPINGSIFFSKLIGAKVNINTGFDYLTKKITGIRGTDIYIDYKNWQSVDCNYGFRDDRIVYFVDYFCYRSQFQLHESHYPRASCR